MGATYLLDLVTEKGHYIIGHYLDLIGIIDPVNAVIQIGFNFLRTDDLNGQFF